MELGVYTFAELRAHQETGETISAERFLGQISSDDPVTMPHDKVMRAIELLGFEVAPAVRKEVARRNEASATPVGS